MKKLIALAAAAVAAFSLSACNPVIIGDSVSNMTRTQYAAHMPNVLVDAADGRGAYNAGVNGQTGTGLQAIQNQLANVGVNEWMVVQLGGNNLSFTQAQRRTFINQVLAAVPNDRCLAWVYPYALFNDAANAGWAADLDLLLPHQPCHSSIRWDLIGAFYHTTYFADFVHPNAAGKELLACMIAINTGTAVGC
jgi:lysophospholipase L1-like esterase